ncbi:MAG: aquaporin [Anaerolineae bacterium]|nr:aquaporin [Anaerolineae bacterium]MDQ7034552.1 aquaporin [Anaerolineae bacterium]
MNLKELLAELIGTFTLCFIGIGSVIVAPQFGIVAPALGHGLVLVGLIFAYGHLSGAQFNPAVTFGLLVGQKITPMKAGAYIVVQFIGGIIAAYLIVTLVGGADGAALTGFLGGAEFNYGQTTGFLTENNVWQAAAIEAVLVFFLVSAVYQAAVYGKAGNLAAMAIGLTLAACIFATGGMTGASVNPARTFGPALVAGEFSYVLPYFVGLFAGGAIAGAIHGYVLTPDEE